MPAVPAVFTASKLPDAREIGALMTSVARLYALKIDAGYACWATNGKDEIDLRS